MKATELMINDWIQIDEPDRYAGAIGQIKSLLHHKDEDSAYFHVFIQGTHGYVMREVCSDDIRPIPLTPEILEKNGFEEGKGGNFCRVLNIDEYKYVLYNFNDSFIYIRNEFYNMDVQIHYVHQLQHALRLCGIEKEIEL